MLVRAWVAGLAVLADLAVPLAVATPAAARTGTLAYVVNQDADSVSVIDTVTNTVTTTITVGDDPQEAAVTPDGSRVYVTNSGADTVSVIDTATDTVVDTIPVGNGPSGVAVTPDGSRVYVANFGDDTVSVINTATNTVIDTVTVGVGPLRVAIGTVTSSDRTPTKLTLKLEKKKGKGKDVVDALGDGGRKGLVLKAKLSAEREPLEGQPIEFTTDLVELCTDTTDSKGKATCKVPREQADETCYTATFAGDDTYEPSTATFCRFNDTSDQLKEPANPEGRAPSPARHSRRPPGHDVTATPAARQLITRHIACTTRGPDLNQRQGHDGAYRLRTAADGAVRVAESGMLFRRCAAAGSVDGGSAR